MSNAPIEYLSKLDRTRQALDGSVKESIARAVDDGSLELVDQHRHAAVVIAVRGGFQEAWTRREELSTDLYEKLAAVASASRTRRAVLFIGADGTPGVGVL